MQHVSHRASDDMAQLRQENARLREGISAAIRAAELALFVVRKQGVMPNASWERGFAAELDQARAALAQSVSG